MKRTKLTLALILSLIFVMPSVQAVKLAKASSAVSSGLGITSPTNTTYTHGFLFLRVMMVSLVGGNSEISVTYSLDGKANVTVPIVIKGHEKSFQATITASAALPELPEGSHNVTVYSEYAIYRFTSQGIYYPKYSVWKHNTVYFTVDYEIPPVISILSPENKTYNQKDLLLNFTTNEKTSWIGYCLDRPANVAITGNTTLTELAEGSHSIVVYANDTAGNMGASETVFFTVIQEKPPEPFSTMLVTTASVASIAVVGLRLLVYSRKHKD
jgi:hypothetical protein